MEIKNIILSDFATKNEYESFALKELDSTLNAQLTQPHRNAFFQIVLLEQGRGSVMIDFEEYKITAPCICFIFPQQISTFDFESQTKGEVLMFDHSIFCSEILATELKEYNVDLHKRVNVINYDLIMLSQFREILSIKEHIKRIEEPYNNIHKIEIKFLTKIIILKTINSSQTEAFKGVKDKELDVFMEFRRIVDNDFRHDRKVQNYCDRLGVSAKKLNILSKRYGNNTALELIHERLSLEIKKLLIYEQMPLKEIAYSLGFDSQSALNKYIGQKYGCTPTELKKKMNR